MKIRTGFVSNSSSSSFCLLGIEFPKGIGSVTKKDLTKFEEIAVFTNLDGNEGQIVLHISDEDFLKFVQSREQDLELGAVFGVVATSAVNRKAIPRSGKLVLESTIEEQSSPRCLADLKCYLEDCAPELLQDEIKEED
jgi:hypothetical protein